MYASIWTLWIDRVGSLCGHAHTVSWYLNHSPTWCTLLLVHIYANRVNILANFRVIYLLYYCGRVALVPDIYIQFEFSMSFCVGIPPSTTTTPPAPFYIQFSINITERFPRRLVLNFIPETILALCTAWSMHPVKILTFPISQCLVVAGPLLDFIHQVRKTVQDKSHREYLDGPRWVAPSFDLLLTVEMEPPSRMVYVAAKGTSSWHSDNENRSLQIYMLWWSLRCQSYETFAFSPFL